ncbi:DUF6932 family protein [Cylindrospermum sp. FACHB-282]|uniref:DUF6932 family protein n=1 Tax=Cylindrospermum sp. FACHB-282 TaxID=2692794 RepID=UPI0018EF8B25|nr:hypothetical protein [Cylindrospermum sp. FACHB-282]
MLPKFDQNGNLPAGIHVSTWEEIKDVLAFNERRQTLLDGIKRASQVLREAGCRRIYICGSFVSRKTYPNDFDVCWEDEKVDFEILNTLDINLLDAGRNKRLAQKNNYGGELFPASTYADDYGTFLDFLQQDNNGNLRGVIAVDL